MTIDRDRLREVFFAALELPPDAHTRYLDEACGVDAVLRAEVASLLAHHDATFLVEGPDRSLVDALAEAVLPAPVSEDNAPRYRSLGELGAGGFGIVEQRFDRRLRRVVASKAPLVAEAPHHEALLREARLLAYLDHPGVVQIYDLRDDEHELSYTMELIEGESLAARLSTQRTSGSLLPVSEAIRIFARVCETVANAHAKGVLHLDIKPANIMVQGFGHVSLIDWGMARFHDTAPYLAHLARLGEPGIADLQPEDSPGGTPIYMPPEQFETVAQLAPAADLYALGALLFELLIGRPAFDLTDDLRALRARKLRAAPDPRRSRFEISERLGALCTRLLDPDPAARPGSVREVLDELAALADLGSGTERMELDPGDVLFEQGADSTTAYQIESGELEIAVNGQVVATRHTGDIVGELAMLSRTKRTATVRARTPTIVRAIDWEALEDALSKVDPLVGHLLRRLSDKLVETVGQG